MPATTVGRLQDSMSTEPLVDENRVAAWMDDAGSRARRAARGRAHHDRSLERGVPRGARRPRRRAAPTTAHTAVADRARHGARVPRVAALHDPAGWHGRRPCRCPSRSRVAPIVDVIGAPFYLMHPSTASSCASRCPAVLAADPEAARGVRVRAGRRARRHPPLRLARGRARRLRPSRRISRTPGAALARPARALQDAPAARGRRRPGSGSQAHMPPMQPPGSDPRRLQARQRDVRAAPAGRARRGGRLGAVDDRRSARRSRLGARAVGRAGRRARRSRRRRPFAGRTDVPTRRELLERYAAAHRPRPRARQRTTACSACSSSRA